MAGAFQPNAFESDAFQGAAANVVITPPAGALVVTGFAPSVATPRKVTPALRALVLTGFAPSVATPRRVTPAHASLTLTGFAPSVSTPRLVSPAKASLTLTGFAPSVATPRRVTPAIAALTLTGYAPTVTVTSPSVTVTPASASLALTGYAPAVKVKAFRVGGRALPIHVSPVVPHWPIPAPPAPRIAAESEVVILARPDNTAAFAALYAAGALDEAEFAALLAA